MGCLVPKYGLHRDFFSLGFIVPGRVPCVYFETTIKVFQVFATYEISHSKILTFKQ